MKKLLFILCTLILLLTTAFSGLLLVLFLGNVLPDFRIDVIHADVPILRSVLINLGLLLIFGFQHSGMARKWFKQISRKWIPYGLERMVYSVISSMVLFLLIFFWQPIPILLWNIEVEWVQIVLYALFFLGWFLVLVSSALIDGLRFAGIRQLAAYFLGKKEKPSTFKTPILYKIIRHPIYLGFLLAIWASPVMTLSHFLFSLGMTVYTLIGIQYEERDLIDRFGDEYRNYQKTTPMLLPRKLSLN